MLGYLLAVVVGLVVFQVSIFLTTIYLHRGLSHKSLTMRPGLQFACRVVIWLTTGIRPRQWAAVHRKHHAFTDMPGDPHSPVLEGFWKVQLNNVGLYRKSAKDPSTVERYAKDLPPDRWDTVLFDHALLGLGIGVGLLFVVFRGNWKLVLVAAVLQTVAYLGVSSSVNAVGHRFGSRPFAGLAANNQWLAWLTAGEGLHSNHHAAPTSARFSFHRGQLDPGWWAISACKRLKWVTVRHAEPRLSSKARRTPELV